MDKTKEWEMVEALIEGHRSGDYELHGDHLLFLFNPTDSGYKEPGLFQLLDPYMPAEEQLPEWKMKTLYWLYEWHEEENYMPYDEFEYEVY